MLTILSLVCVCLMTNTVKGNTGMHKNHTQSEYNNISISTDLYKVSPDLPSWVRTTIYSLRDFLYYSCFAGFPCLLLIPGYHRQWGCFLQTFHILPLLQE